MCSHACVHTCGGKRSNVLLTLTLCTMFVEAGTLARLSLTDLIWLAGQRAPWIFLSPCPP